VDIPRILLADFENDTIEATRRTLAAYWPPYVEALRAGDETEQKRWTLFGVRLDTSGSMVDRALQPDGATGVNAELVRRVRAALDSAWESWAVPADLLEAAQTYCRNVQIVVTGGFNADKISAFENSGVPVDVYGVGSSFLRNDSNTNTDYTMDVVRVKLGGEWVDMAKVGRKPCANPALQQVDLSDL
jgi:nicotinate phosphoribosyltransferase